MICSKRAKLEGLALAAIIAFSALCFACCAPANERRLKKIASPTCKLEDYESAVTRYEKTFVSLDKDGAVIITTVKQTEYRPTAGLIRLGFGLRPSRGETLEIETALSDETGMPQGYKPTVFDEPPALKTALSDPDLKIRTALFPLEKGGFLTLKTVRRIPKIEGFSGVYAAVYSASPLRVCRAEISLSPEIQKEAIIKISEKLKLFTGFYEKKTPAREPGAPPNAKDRTLVIEQMDGGAARTKLVEISTFKEWESLAGSLYKKYAPTPDAIKLVKSVFPNMPQDANDAFNHLRDNTTASPRYCSDAPDFMFPAPIGRVLSAKAGTCKDLSYILAVALKARRFSPYVVFLNLRENLREDFPTDNFNHAVAAVKLSNGLWRFFDPTTGNSVEAENRYYPSEDNETDLPRESVEGDEREESGGAEQNGVGFAVDSTGSYLFLSVPVKKLRTRLTPNARPASADAKISFKEAEGGAASYRAEYLFTFRDDGEKEPLFIPVPYPPTPPQSEAECSAFAHEELGTRKLDASFIIKTRDAEGRPGFVLVPPKNVRKFTVTLTGTADMSDGPASLTLPFDEREAGKIEITCAKPLTARHYAKEGTIAIFRDGGRDSILRATFEAKSYYAALAAYLKLKAGSQLGTLPSLYASAKILGFKGASAETFAKTQEFKPAIITSCDDPKCAEKPPFAGVWSLVKLKEGNAVEIFPMNGACAKTVMNPIFGSAATFADGSTRRLLPSAKDSSTLSSAIEIKTDYGGGPLGGMTIKASGGFACSLLYCRARAGFPPAKAALFEKDGEVEASWPLEVKLIGGDESRKRLAFRLYPNVEECGNIPANALITSTIVITTGADTTAQIDEATLYALKGPAMKGLKFSAVPGQNELKISAELKIEDGTVPPPPVINIVIVK